MVAETWLFKCENCGYPLLVTRGALNLTTPLVPPIEARVEMIACPICGRSASYQLPGLSLDERDIRVKIGKYFEWALFHQHWNFVFKPKFGELNMEDVVPYQSLPDFYNEMLRMHFEFKSRGFDWTQIASSAWCCGKVFVNQRSLMRKIEHARANPSAVYVLVEFFRDVGYYGCRVLNMEKYLNEIVDFGGREVRGSAEPAVLIPQSEFRSLSELIETRSRELGL